MSRPVVMVTGATGFLGTRLVNLLLNDELTVRCLVRPQADTTELSVLATTGRRGTLEILAGELASPPGHALAGVSVVYHLATAMTGSRAVIIDGNIATTSAFATAAAQAHVGRFVLVSSMGIYGTQNLKSGDVVDETVELEPHPEWRDSYSAGKIGQEQVVQEISRTSGMPVVIVRPGVIFGPGRSLITSRLGVVLGDWIVHMGGGQTVPCTYVENCAEAVRLAGSVPGVENEAFNIVDDVLPTSRELLRECRRHGRRVSAIWVPRPLIQPLAAIYGWCSSSSGGRLPPILSSYKAQSLWKPLRYENRKAKQCLGWVPRISTCDAIRRTLEMPTRSASQDGSEQPV